MSDWQTDISDRIDKLEQITEMYSKKVEFGVTLNCYYFETMTNPQSTAQIRYELYTQS